MAYYDNFIQRNTTNVRKKIQLSFLSKLFSSIDLNFNYEMKFLEIGPGKGFVTELVKDRVDYHCIEPNKNLAQYLSRDLNVNVTSVMVPPIPFSDNSFDVIYHSHVLEHMASSTIAFDFISECKRVLRPGGQLIFLCPDYIRMGNYFWDVDYTHTFVTTENRIKHLLQDCNLIIDVLKPVTEPIAGKWGLLIGLIMRFFPYQMLSTLFPYEKSKLVIWKIKSTFIQSLFIVATKEKN